MLSSIILTEHTSLARVMAFSLPRVLCQCSLFCISGLTDRSKNSLALELVHALNIKHFTPRSPTGQAWKELRTKRDLGFVKEAALENLWIRTEAGSSESWGIRGMRHSRHTSYNQLVECRRCTLGFARLSSLEVLCQ